MALAFYFSPGDDVRIADVGFHIDWEQPALRLPNHSPVRLTNQPTDTGLGIKVSLSYRQPPGLLGIAFDGPPDIPIRRIRAEEPR